MGLRLRLARRYAALQAPAPLQLRAGTGFAVPSVSPPLLTRTRVSRDLSIPVQTPQMLVDLYGKRPLTSPSAFAHPILPELPGTLSADGFLPEAVGVSQNLLTPIGSPDARGKNYAQPEEQLGLFREGARDDEPRRPSKPRKAYAEQRVVDGTLRRTASVWDLILPLLKPPLDFDFPAQLDFPSELYPFQVEGVRRLVQSQSFLLGDEMGTGKTVMSTVALRILFHRGIVRKALVVSPASVLPVWDRHLLDWGGPHLLCTNVRGTKEVRQKDWEYPAHVYVASYDTFRNDVRGARPLLSQSALGSFDLVILDEVHHIRNPSSGRSRAVRELTPSYRWALSGTPLQNSLEDLIAVFSFVKPGLLPWDTQSTSKATRAIQPHFLRRMKRDVMPELPEKIGDEIWLELDAEQRSAYEEALNTGRGNLASGKTGFSRVHIFALLRKLMQICNFAPGKAWSPKTDLLIDQIEEVIQDHKVVVFTNYVREGVEKIQPKLDKYGLAVITGQTPLAQRQRVIQRFQDNPDVRVFLGTTKAAGEGITLTEGNYVFHFDQWWNPAVAWQAEDRVHRKGQRRQVNVYSYFMDNTVEVRIRQKLREKGLLFDEVINALSEKDIDTSLTMKDWCEILDLELDVRDEGERPSGEVALGEMYASFSRLSPEAFERLTADVFRNLGYSVQQTGQSYDGGIDVVASRPSLGGKELVVVQCKRRRQVGVEVARELLGVVAADPQVGKGFLVVSGTLSAGCRDFVRQHGNLSSIEGLELARRALELGISLPRD